MAKILIIEDEEFMRDVFGDMLSIDGHDVDCYETIEDGLKAYFEIKPDLIISDWSLPDGSGEKVIDEIILKEKSCSIIVSTGQEDKVVDDKLEYKKNLRYVILSKPFDINGLLESVKMFMQEG